jgi:hypothetical protein
MMFIKVIFRDELVFMLKSESNKTFEVKVKERSGFRFNGITLS